MDGGRPWVAEISSDSSARSTSPPSRRWRGAQTLAGQAVEGEATLLRAVDHPTADILQVHQLGRTLIAAGRAETAMRILESNAQRHGDAWPVHVGLMRGHSALGRYPQALEHARKAVVQAPDELNRTALEAAIERLEVGEDVH